MKNITVLLQQGNLRPKERILLLVHDRVNEDLTGKKILTEADKRALVEAWRPKDNSEVSEYNLYNRGWQLEGGARLDCQTIYLNAYISLLKAGRLVDYVMWKDYSDKDSFFKGINIGVDDDVALDHVLQSSGLQFDRVVYMYAFHSLSEDIKKDMLILCPDAKTESQYFDQEEVVMELFDGKKELTTEAKEKLTSIMLDVMHNKYAEIIHNKGLKWSEWWFDGYFADMPTIEIVKKWADINNIHYDTETENPKDELIEKISDYADTHNTTVRELLRSTISRWLDNGLFVSDYSPIWNSDNKQTCNDADTTLAHKEVFKHWLIAKKKSHALIQALVDEGRLQIEHRETDFFGMKETMKIITGESLYNLDGDYVFASDYKKQADDLKPLGVLTVHIQRCGFSEEYASLLAFVDMYKKLSKIYDIDLGYKIHEYVESLKSSVMLLDRELNFTTEKLTEAIYKKHDITFLIEITDDKSIHIEDIQPGTGEMETHYSEEFKKLFGSEF